MICMYVVNESVNLSMSVRVSVAVGGENVSASVSVMKGTVLG